MFMVRRATRPALGRTAWAVAIAALLAGCSGGGGLRDALSGTPENAPAQFDPRLTDEGERRDTIWDLFVNVDDPNVTVEVNRYLWNASLDILSFLPVQSIDPFSGVIVMGYGTPPGGRTTYRATVHVTDPALDARSLRVALATRGGPVSADTQRAVEDAILTRARQLRLRDGRL